MSISEACRPCATLPSLQQHGESEVDSLAPRETARSTWAAHPSGPPGLRLNGTSEQARRRHQPLEPRTVAAELFRDLRLVAIGDRQHVRLELGGGHDEAQVVEKQLLGRGGCFVERPATKCNRLSDFAAVLVGDRRMPCLRSFSCASTVRCQRSTSVSRGSSCALRSGLKGPPIVSPDSLTVESVRRGRREAHARSPVSGLRTTCMAAGIPQCSSGRLCYGVGRRVSLGV